jgi:DNA-binding response OmpR family regulator
MGKRILYVEDDPTLARSLARVLTGEGWLVDVAQDGACGLRHAHAHGYEVALVNWRLPGTIDGMQICRSLRERSPNAWVILLSVGSADNDIIDALDAGADEYIVKPCTARVVVARIRAHVRRSEPPNQSNQSGTHVIGPFRLRYGMLDLELISQTLEVAGTTIAITRHQFQLLAYMVSNAGRAVSVDEFRAHLLRTTHQPESSNIRRQIMQLRAALGDHGGLIETDRGMGYGVGIAAHRTNGAK